MKLIFFVRAVLQTAIRDSLTVWLNGVQLTLDRVIHKHGQAEFTVELPSAILQQNPFACIELKVSHTCAPHDIDPHNADERQLGLQIDWIEIQPV